MQAHEIGPDWDARRHAEIMAALHNGAMQRQDKRPFSAADFMPRDPWAPPEPPKVVASAQELMAEMAATGMLEVRE